MLCYLVDVVLVSVVGVAYGTTNCFFFWGGERVWMCGNGCIVVSLCSVLIRIIVDGFGLVVDISFFDSEIWIRFLG